MMKNKINFKQLINKEIKIKKEEKKVDLKNGKNILKNSK